jgi:hypothetical protein
VYGVARRRLRDAHLAEDVTQAVFILLHRKAPKFTADGALIAWLHRAARYASENAARGEPPLARSWGDIPTGFMPFAGGDWETVHWPRMRRRPCFSHWRGRHLRSSINPL